MADEKNLDLEDLDQKDQDNITANDYVQKLKQIQKDYVPKEKYEELMKEKETLSDALLDGLDAPVPEVKPVSKETLVKQREVLRSRLMDKDAHRSNLEIAQDTLELRDICIKLDGKKADPFVPTGAKIKATQNDYDEADKVAACFKECIEYAKGDSQLFTQELSRRTIDANPYYDGPEI